MKRLVLVVVFALALAAPAVGAPATTLHISTASGGAFKFDRKVLTAHPGRVTIVLTNTQVMPHNVALKGNGVGVKGKIVLKGGTSSVTAVLKKGSYRFYCSVPGHEAAGMWGTLVVK